MAISARRQLFIDEYLKDCNAQASAVRAGYSKIWARKWAAKRLTDPEMAEALKAAMDKRSKRTEISQDWVLKNLKEVAERCMQKVPVMYFDKEDKCMRQETTLDGEGVWQFDASGANKSLELIGKHLGMFKDRVEHSGNVGVTLPDLLAKFAARKADAGK